MEVRRSIRLSYRRKGGHPLLSKKLLKRHQNFFGCLESPVLRSLTMRITISNEVTFQPPLVSPGAYGTLIIRYISRCSFYNKGAEPPRSPLPSRERTKVRVSYYNRGMLAVNNLPEGHCERSEAISSSFPQLHYPKIH